MLYSNGEDWVSTDGNTLAVTVGQGDVDGEICKKRAFNPQDAKGLLVTYSAETNQVFNGWFFDTILSQWQQSVVFSFLVTLEVRKSPNLVFQDVGFGSEHLYLCLTAKQLLTDTGLTADLKKLTASKIGAATIQEWLLTPFANAQNPEFVHRQQWLKVLERVDEVSVRKTRESLAVTPVLKTEFAFKNVNLFLAQHAQLVQLIRTAFVVSDNLKSLKPSDKLFQNNIRLFSLNQLLRATQTKITALSATELSLDEKKTLQEVENQLRAQTHSHTLKVILINQEEAKKPIVDPVVPNRAVIVMELAATKRIKGGFEVVPLKAATTKRLKKQCPRIQNLVAVTTAQNNRLNTRYSDRLHAQQAQMESVAEGFYTHLKPLKTLVAETYSALGFFDAALALTKYQAGTEWQWPTSAPTASGLTVQQLKNPQKKKSDAIDFQMEHKLKILGSNASGKSSLLKTVALNVILRQMGGKTLGSVAAPFYSELLMRLPNDTEHDQFSSFYNQALQIRFLLEKANETALVLLDEVGLGTNLDEGRAFCANVVNHIQTGTLLFATHFAGVGAGIDTVFCECRNGKYTVQRDALAEWKMNADSLCIARKYFVNLTIAEDDYQQKKRQKIY